MNASQIASHPHPAWPDFVHPHRFVHARAALKADPEGVKAARGSQFEETALHWAALGELGLVMDLVAAGFDPNALDRLGRTPLDWFSDLLWMSLVQAATPMSGPGADRLRFKAARQLPALWGQGFRPGPGAARAPGEIWLRAGVYEAVSLLADPAQQGLGLRAWGEDQASALHAWALADAQQGRSEAFTDLVARGLVVDELDAHGRTPLRYALEAWAGGLVHRRSASATVKTLLAAGADPQLADNEGIAPGMVPLLREMDDKRQSAMVRLLEEAAAT